MRFTGLTCTFLAAVVAAATLCACSSFRHVSDEYRDSLSPKVKSTSPRTVIVFLIDGLPAFTLQRELGEGHLPHIERYFVPGKNQTYLARTAFPSLTFPGIGSLLTEKPVDGNGLYGNQIYYDGDKVNFESPLNSKELTAITQGKNIFARLRAKGLKTVSIDYAFRADTDASIRLEDAEAALDIQNKQYQNIDEKLIRSLADLLDSTAPKAWPDFIFVHLVGVDFLTHDHGPDAPEVRDYLHLLDANLKRVLDKLTVVEAKRQRQVVALLTADHGVDVRIKRFLPLEKVFDKLDPRIRVLNEGRYLSLFFPKAWGPTKKEALLSGMLSQPDIEIVADREAADAHVRSKELTTAIQFLPANCPESHFAIAVMPSATPATAACPEHLDAQTNQLYYPYFISNLAHFFETPGHPDAVIIPKPGVTFKDNGYLGQHGGPTVREVFVPLLLRNASLATPEKIPALWELLGFVE